MEYNFISIDPSLISTVLIVNNKIFNYCRINDINKWFKYLNNILNLRFISYNEGISYSHKEVLKIKDYDNITSIIINDIKSNLIDNIPTKISIEGLSFNSKGSYRLELISFSTILKNKLKDISEDILILPPSTLKKESGRLIYMDGKTTGGKYTKHDMFICLINSNYDDEFVNVCRELRNDILKLKKIPKPYEDIVDCFLLYKILESKTFNLI